MLKANKIFGDMIRMLFQSSSAAKLCPCAVVRLLVSELLNGAQQWELTVSGANAVLDVRKSILLMCAGVRTLAS